MTTAAHSGSSIARASAGCAELRQWAAELDEGGDVIAWYVMGLGLDEPLARIENSGAVHYYHADILGSIVALTDGSGAVTTRYNYSPFGETQVIGEQSANPLRFVAKYHDDETGMIIFPYRTYAPDLGRFISEDPLRFDAGDVNFYVYVGNNPINYVDPLGLYECVGNANCKDLTDTMKKKLTCFEECVQKQKTGMVLKVTSGKDSHISGPHTKGEAVDLGGNNNPGLCKGETDVKKCFDECFSGGYGQEEYNDCTESDTHVHLQEVPGTSGGTYYADKIVKHKGCK